MKSRQTVLLSILVSSLLGALGPVAAQSPASFTLEAQSMTFDDPVRPGTLQASIRWGEIRIVGYAGTDVRVVPRIEVDANLAARYSERELLDRIDVRLERRNGAIEIVADANLEGFYGVELDVEAPFGTALALEIRDGGNIDIRDVLGEVEISNRNGSVELSGIDGGAVVHARNGSIRAGFSRVPGDAPMSFSSLNGSVDVTFPEEPDADVTIRYNRGGVESDFPIVSGDGFAAADTAGLDGRATRVMEGRLGDGGVRYYFHTANGTVYLRRGAPTDG